MCGGCFLIFFGGKGSNLTGAYLLEWGGSLKPPPSCGKFALELFAVFKLGYFKKKYATKSIAVE